MAKYRSPFTITIVSKRGRTYNWTMKTMKAAENRYSGYISEDSILERRILDADAKLVGTADGGWQTAGIRLAGGGPVVAMNCQSSVKNAPGIPWVITMNRNFLTLIQSH